MCALAEPADQLLWEFDSTGAITWTDLVDKLRSRYGSLDQASLFQTQLSTRRQRDGEDLCTLVQDIRRLITLAYPGTTSHLTETIAIRGFLDALRDRSLALRVREREPESLDAAYKITMRLEAYRKADLGYRETTELRPGRVKTVKESELVTEATLRKILREEQRQHDKETRDRLDRLEGFCKQPFAWAGPPASDREPSAQWSIGKERRVRSGRHGGWHSNSERPARRCYLCDDHTHLAKECPYPRQQSTGPTQDTHLHHVQGCSNAYLPLRVRGKSVRALIDSGSQMSLVPARLVRPKDMVPSNQSLSAANGTPIRVLGETTLRCEAGDYQFETPCLVTAQINELILGLDLLETQKVQWNFGEQWLRIQDHTFSLLSQQRSGQCRKIAMARDVDVPARCELDVDTYIILPDLKGDQEVWATQPQVLNTGLVLAGTLLPDRTLESPIRVMNLTDKTIRLRKDMQWKLESVTLLETERIEAGATECANVHETTTEAEVVLAPLWTDVAEDVPTEMRQRLKALILEHHKAFSLNEWDLGYTNILQHEIETGTEVPVRQPLRRQPLTLLPFIDEQVDMMLQQNLIEPSSSAWASNVVMVQKRDGTPRFCVDYRAVNLKTRKDAYPLPLISESLDTLAGAKWFSTFDLRAGYHQVAVHPKDRHKTAFVTRRGSFQFRVLPFGLTNSPASFSRMMNLVMAGLNFAICLIYLDDIIIFASDLDTHLERLSQVLKRLSDVNLKLKPTKCHLLRKRVLFLGHIVSEDGVTTDPEKIEAVKSWPAPTNLKEVRAFVGFCSYYRKFVPDFASIARPLHDLTRKGVLFCWSPETEQAFEQLKSALTEPPILALPSVTGTYILDTDASGDAIGAVLSQVQDGQERVICYGSRICSPAERNYDVTRREMLATVYFLKTYRPYLLGQHFVLRTDHAALQWLRRTPTPIGQQARWLTILEEFQFEVKHRAGSAHTNADAMSRRPHTTRAITETTSQHPTASPLPWDWSRLEVARELLLDPDLRWILNRKMEREEPPTAEETRALSATIKTLVSQWEQLAVQDGLLVRKLLNADDNSVRWYQLIPPVVRRCTVIRLAHEGMSGGHLGLRRTLVQAQRRAYWPGWREDVQNQLRECTPCAQYLRGKTPRQGRLQNLNVGEPMECLGIDITGPHPTSSKGNKYIMTVIDHFTRWAEGYPIRNQEAHTVTKNLVDHWISRFGCPRQILTDQGPCFEAALFRELCQALQIDKIRTSAYKPSTNITVERFHRTLNSMLGKVVSSNQRDWDTHLPFVLAAYRASVHESTGFSPNKLLLGRETCLPVDLVLGDCLLREPQSTGDDSLASRLQNIQRDFAAARECMKRQATRRAFRYDLRVRPATFRVGQWVWLYYPRRRPGIKDKWAKWYTGPFRIMGQVGPVLYRVQKSMRAHAQLVYVDKLKPYFGETPKAWREDEAETSGRPIRSAPAATGEIPDPAPLRTKRDIRAPIRFGYD